jgi:hypothetical protein
MCEDEDDGGWSRRHPPVTEESLFAESQALREEYEREEEQVLEEIARCEASDNPDDQMWGRHLRELYDLPVSPFTELLREMLPELLKNPPPKLPPGRISL